MHTLFQRHTNHLSKRLSSSIASLSSRDLNGIVASVSGDVVQVAGFNDARLFSLVTFARGAVGLITSLPRSGGARIILIRGPTPLAAETVVSESRAVALRGVNGGARFWAGRIVDAIGDPIDGRGTISNVSSSTTSSSKVKISQNFGDDFAALAGGGSTQVSRAASMGFREIASGALALGHPALDSFAPLLRGRSLALLSGSTNNTQDQLTQVAISASIAASRLHKKAPLRVIWGTVGMSSSSVRKTAFALKHLQPQPTIFAAPIGSSRAGASALTHAAAIALGEAVRDSGSDALVILEGCVASAQAIRLCGGEIEGGGVASGGGGGGNALGGIVSLPSLLDRASQMNADRGGGSLSIIALIDAPPDSLGVARDVRAAASLADDCVELTSTTSTTSSGGGGGAEFRKHVLGF